MADILEFAITVKLEPVEFTCGHVNYLTARFVEQRRRDHNNFWCSACGHSNCYPAPKQEEVKALPPTIGQKVVNLFRRANTARGEP